MIAGDLQARMTRRAEVPCGSCSACCRHDTVRLCKPAELERFQWHREGAYAVLDRKTDGSCIYLTNDGCGVHDSPPDVCQRFDCRVLVAATPRAQRVIRIIESPQMAAVYAAGLQRTHTLRAE